MAENGAAFLGSLKNRKRNVRKMKFILASGSPRRKELMEMMGVVCEIQPSGADEKVSSAEPERVVEELSRLKCLDVAALTKGDAVVIGADTVVAFEGEILGKPKGREDAKRMMERLQGHVHQVYTGVTIVAARGDEKKTVTFCDCTEVEFYPMSEKEILDYLDEEKEGMAPVWSDKAGGYGIQTAFGTRFIRQIRGDYYNVMGLPASRVYHELKKLGVLKAE